MGNVIDSICVGEKDKSHTFPISTSQYIEANNEVTSDQGSNADKPNIQCTKNLSDSSDTNVENNVNSGDKAECSPSSSREEHDDKDEKVKELDAPGCIATHVTELTVECDTDRETHKGIIKSSFDDSGIGSSSEEDDFQHFQNDNDANGGLTENINQILPVTNTNVVRTESSDDNECSELKECEISSDEIVAQSNNDERHAYSDSGCCTDISGNDVEATYAGNANEVERHSCSDTVNDNQPSGGDQNDDNDTYKQEEDTSANNRRRGVRLLVRVGNQLLPIPARQVNDTFNVRISHNDGSDASNTHVSCSEDLKGRSHDPAGHTDSQYKVGSEKEQASSPSTVSALPTCTDAVYGIENMEEAATTSIDVTDALGCATSNDAATDEREISSEKVVAHFTKIQSDWHDYDKFSTCSDKGSSQMDEGYDSESDEFFEQDDPLTSVCDLASSCFNRNIDALGASEVTKYDNKVAAKRDSDFPTCSSEVPEYESEVNTRDSSEIATYESKFAICESEDAMCESEVAAKCGSDKPTSESEITTCESEVATCESDDKDENTTYDSKVVICDNALYTKCIREVTSCDNRIDATCYSEGVICDNTIAKCRSEIDAQVTCDNEVNATCDSQVATCNTEVATCDNEVKDTCDNEVADLDNGGATFDNDVATSFSGYVACDRKNVTSVCENDATCDCNDDDDAFDSDVATCGSEVECLTEEDQSSDFHGDVYTKILEPMPQRPEVSDTVEPTNDDGLIHAFVWGRLIEIWLAAKASYKAHTFDNNNILPKSEQENETDATLDRPTTEQSISICKNMKGTETQSKMSKTDSVAVTNVVNACFTDKVEPKSVKDGTTGSEIECEKRRRVVAHVRLRSRHGRYTFGIRFGGDNNQMFQNIWQLQVPYGTDDQAGILSPFQEYTYQLTQYRHNTLTADLNNLPQLHEMRVTYGPDGKFSNFTRNQPAICIRKYRFKFFDVFVHIVHDSSNGEIRQTIYRVYVILPYSAWNSSASESYLLPSKVNSPGHQTMYPGGLAININTFSVRFSDDVPMSSFDSDMFAKLCHVFGTYTASNGVLRYLRYMDIQLNGSTALEVYVLQDCIKMLSVGYHADYNSMQNDAIAVTDELNVLNEDDSHTLISKVNVTKMPLESMQLFTKPRERHVAVTTRNTIANCKIQENPNRYQSKMNQENKYNINLHFYAYVSHVVVPNIDNKSYTETKKYSQDDISVHKPRHEMGTQTDKYIESRRLMSISCEHCIKNVPIEATVKTGYNIIYIHLQEGAQIRDIQVGSSSNEYVITGLGNCIDLHMSKMTSEQDLGQGRTYTGDRKHKKTQFGTTILHVEDVILQLSYQYQHPKMQSLNGTFRSCLHSPGCCDCLEIRGKHAATIDSSEIHIYVSKQISVQYGDDNMSCVVSPTYFQSHNYDPLTVLSTARQCAEIPGLKHDQIAVMIFIKPGEITHCIDHALHCECQTMDSIRKNDESLVLGRTVPLEGSLRSPFNQLNHDPCRSLTNADSGHMLNIQDPRVDNMSHLSIEESRSKRSVPDTMMSQQLSDTENPIGGESDLECDVTPVYDDDCNYHPTEAQDDSNAWLFMENLKDPDLALNPGSGSADNQETYEKTPFISTQTAPETSTQSSASQSPNAESEPVLSELRGYFNIRHCLESSELNTTLRKSGFRRVNDSNNETITFVANDSDLRMDASGVKPFFQEELARCLRDTEIANAGYPEGCFEITCCRFS